MKSRSAQWKRSMVVIIVDLSLLLSIALARFIVWRTIRARNKERLARLRNLRLIKGGVPLSSTGNHVLMPACVGEKEMLRAAAPCPAVIRPRAS